MSVVDHKAVLAGLTADEREALIARSDAAGLRHLGGHVGAIAVGATLIGLRVPGWQAVLIVQGVLVAFLFTLLHETVHRTPFKTRRLNDAVAKIVAFSIFLLPVWFRHFHLAHHRYTNDPERDPELSAPRPSTPAQFFIYLSGVPEMVARFTNLARNALRPNTDSYVPERSRAIVRREAVTHIAAYVVLAVVSVSTSSALLFWIWVLPVMIGAPFLRAYLLAEHADCPRVENMLENTRTTFTGRLVRFVTWNMPFHAEHHAFPAVPFHKLPAFHEHTRDHLLSTEDGYVNFTRTYLRNVTATES